MQPAATMSVISELNAKLHPCLLSRINRLSPLPPASTTKRFVLYLPSVNLRIDQNPAFALACHAANAHQVPLVVLAVVVDDTHHNVALSGVGATVMTSRRLAFTLQALSHVCKQWSDHGAAVGIRIHGPPSNERRKIAGARTPDHLTLASRASFVVTDEPFVHPYLNFVQKVEGACRKSGVECVRVDGSCTVPPLQVLKRTPNNAGVLFDGVPDKAYLWMKKTEKFRSAHLNAAKDGAFDAPKLVVRMEDDELFLPTSNESNLKAADDASSELPWGQRLAHLFPSRWKSTLDTDGNAAVANAPDVRPFTSAELLHLYQHDNYFDDDSKIKVTPTDSKATTPLHNFAINWPGADSSVPPVNHTIGTARHGRSRWKTWVENGGLSRYARERNDARNNLKGVSRMSAYLNLGIVSIFKLALDMTQHSTYGGSSSNTKWKAGADKFEEELIKFREHSYAHCFSRTDYDAVTSLPRWSVLYLDRQDDQYSISQLSDGSTNDRKWNSMQRYLVNTGELHNNVRMTWGKTVVEWGVHSDDASSTQSQTLLKALCYINDRYGLDGLSPPSYGGLLWCMGWTDKPDNNGGVSPKPAHRYKLSIADFQEAEKKLLDSSPNSTSEKSNGKVSGQASLKDIMTAKTKSSSNARDDDSSIPSLTKKRKVTIDSFFQRRNPK